MKPEEMDRKRTMLGEHGIADPVRESLATNPRLSEHDVAAFVQQGFRDGVLVNKCLKRIRESVDISRATQDRSREQQRQDAALAREKAEWRELEAKRERARQIVQGFEASVVDAAFEIFLARQTPGLAREWYRRQGPSLTCWIALAEILTDGEKVAPRASQGPSAANGALVEQAPLLLPSGEERDG